MNTIIVLSALFAMALAGPIEQAFVDFEEDTTGNYKLNYNTKSASRNEERHHNGKVVGSYSYYDDLGQKHVIHYIAAGDHGFTAEGADIPVAPVSVPETHENLHARAEHLAIVAKERSLHPYVEEEKPVPVEHVLAKLVVPEIATLPESAVPHEDHEIYAARSELLHAYSVALARLAEEYKHHH